MNDYKEKHQKRLLDLARDVIVYVKSLPNTVEYQVVKRQLVRCVTSVGANYHSACRAKSNADFIYKLHVVEEECDESIYWMKLIGNLRDERSKDYLALLDELNQILAITIASINTVKKGERNNSGSFP